MEAGLELVLLDQDFQNSGLIENYTSLQWIRRYYEPGTFELHASPEYFQQARKSRYLYHNLNDETAIIEDVYFTQNQQGQTDLILKGRFLEALLYDRVINNNESLSGNLESSLRNLVVKYAMTGERKINLLQLGTTRGFTDKVNVQTTGDNLMNKLYDILQTYEMSYRIHYDYINNHLYFELWKGLDRTQEQDENSWAIFSNSYENVLETNYERNDSDYKNFAYVAGEGKGQQRIIETVDIIKPGELRRELYVDARDLQTQKEDGTEIPIDTYRSMLRQRGLEKLNEYRLVEPIDGKVDIKSNLIYRDNFDLGDLCDYENESIGLSIQKRITEIQEIYENGDMEVHTVFGEDYILNIDKIIQKGVK